MCIVCVHAMHVDVDAMHVDVHAMHVDAMHVDVHAHLSIHFLAFRQSLTESGLLRNGYKNNLTFL